MSNLFEKNKNKNILVDLDGTLVTHFKGPYKPGVYGDPVWPMINAAKRAITCGHTVKIFTARMDNDEATQALEANAIMDLCRQWGLVDANGNAPSVTNKKDKFTWRIWDDRARSIVQDKGVVGYLDLW